MPGLISLFDGANASDVPKFTAMGHGYIKPSKSVGATNVRQIVLCKGVPAVRDRKSPVAGVTFHKE